MVRRHGVLGFRRHSVARAVCLSFSTCGWQGRLSLQISQNEDVLEAIFQKYDMDMSMSIGFEEFTRNHEVGNSEVLLVSLLRTPLAPRLR